MNADLLILRMASKRRNALNERDGAGLRLWRSAQLRRSSDSVEAPSSVAAALQPSTQLVVFVVSLLEVLPAAPRGRTRRHLEGRRELRAA